MSWVLVLALGILQVLGANALASWVWFRLKRKTSHRLVFTTYTDGMAWSDANGPMPRSWLTAGLTMYLHHREMPTPELWLFQLSHDFSEGQLTPFKSEVDNDTDGRPYPYRHVFIAPSWESAKDQIECLRFGHLVRRPPEDEKSLN